MKSSKIIYLFSGFFLAVSVCCLAAEKQQEQTYVAKIIVNAPWGQKNHYMDREPSPPGEFGIYDPYTRNPKAYDMGPVQGPSSFTVAPNGDIYICDIFNERVQRFSQDGKLVSTIVIRGWRGYGDDLSVDQNENIYVLYSSYTPARVCKYDGQGNLLKEYVSFKDEDSKGMNIGGGSTKLFCDTTGRLFLQYYSEKDREGKVFQLGTATTAFTPQQQKATLRSGSVCNSGIILNKGQIFQVRDGKMFSVDNADKSVTEYKSLISPYSTLDVDAFDNVYLIYYNMEKNTHTIRKQAVDGQFLSSFEWEYERYQLPSPHRGGHVDNNKVIMIDAYGNVYVLAFTNKGLTLTVWSPSEGGK